MKVRNFLVAGLAAIGMASCSSATETMSIEDDMTIDQNLNFDLTILGSVAAEGVKNIDVAIVGSGSALHLSKDVKGHSISLNCKLKKGYHDFMLMANAKGLVNEHSYIDDLDRYVLNLSNRKLADNSLLYSITQRTNFTVKPGQDVHLNKLLVERVESMVNIDSKDYVAPGKLKDIEPQYYGFTTFNVRNEVFASKQKSNLVDFTTPNTRSYSKKITSIFEPNNSELKLTSSFKKAISNKDAQLVLENNSPKNLVGNTTGAFIAFQSKSGKDFYKFFDKITGNVRFSEQNKLGANEEIVEVFKDGMMYYTLFFTNGDILSSPETSTYITRNKQYNIRIKQLTEAGSSIPGLDKDITDPSNPQNPIDPDQPVLEPDESTDVNIDFDIVVEDWLVQEEDKNL